MVTCRTTTDFIDLIVFNGDSDYSITTTPTTMNDEQLCARLNNKRITIDDISRVEQFCRDLNRSSELYDLRNDAKFRAVKSSKTYDEFKDIVDAAHLQPIAQSDKRNASSNTRLWNTIAKD